ncbi:Ribonuclease D [hydrothermal vent metagenome]|uniref:Ribonuclease D n=1 Tax=hydrothermal vent metagenome TaxID=652676 RepID=A0A3B0XY84_9ZZZZ
MSASDTPYLFIDTVDELTVFCDSLKGESWLALDTEFIREKTYYPLLCLLQVGVPGNIACIDPIAIDDMSPLFDILYDRNIVKVIHSCSQDLEIFAYLQGEIPAPIFDTQLAAPLLGFPEQVGYANFVREILGITLDKSQTRTDWSRRPLAPEQLAYAADDVRYLGEIYPAFRDKLKEKGRLEWLDAEFAQYEKVERYIHKPEQAWQRIRGLEKLRSKALSILQVLAAWREAIAQEKNLPRSWVLKDDALVDIARIAPTSLDKLGAIRNFPPRTLDRYGEIIIKHVAEAEERSPEPLPPGKRRTRPTADEDAMADILQAHLRVLAEKYQINSASLASRKELVALAQGEENIPLLKGWRHKMAGVELLAMRDGKRKLTVADGRVVISGADQGNY